MNFHSDRNLVMLSLLYFAILGFFLLGCSEGTSSSPVSALLSEVDTYPTNGKNIIGSIRSINNKKHLGNIRVSLSKYDSAKNEYFHVDDTTSSLNADVGTGVFKFSGLTEGVYKVIINKTPYFKLKEQNLLITGSEIASGTVDYKDIPVTIDVESNSQEINNLVLKVLNAHNGLPVRAANIKIDGKLVDSTNELGKVTINELPVGYHSIEITNPEFVDLIGKFQVEYNEGDIPTTKGNGKLEFCMVEKNPNHRGCITGIFYETDPAYKKPRSIKLYKFSKGADDPSEPGVEFYNLDSRSLKETRTSYGIDNLPNGSFKLLDLAPGFYQLYVAYGSETVVSASSYDIYNLSGNDKDIANYRWQKLDGIDPNGALSRPIEIKEDSVVHWTNIDAMSTK